MFSTLHLSSISSILLIFTVYLRAYRWRILVKDDYVKAHATSIGKSINNFVPSDRIDTLLERDNVRAFLSTADFQFTIIRSALSKILPLELTNEEDYYDIKGKSITKSLMKTPINGARLSSSFGMRKHPILGYNKNCIRLHSPLNLCERPLLMLKVL